MLKMDKIKEYIAEFQARLSERLQVNAQTVVEELNKMGMANVQDFTNPDGSIKNVQELTADQAAAIVELKTVKLKSGAVSTTLKLAPKKDCLVEVGKHLGIYEKDNAQKQPDAPEPGADLDTARRIAFALRTAEENEGTNPPVSH